MTGATAASPTDLAMTHPGTVRGGKLVLDFTGPVAVGGGLAFRSLSLGELFSCGVVAALGTPGQQSSSPGTIYCWGDNVFGQLGNGVAVNNAPALAPTRVSFQP